MISRLFCRPRFPPTLFCGVCGLDKNGLSVSTGLAPVAQRKERHCNEVDGCGFKSRPARALRLPAYTIHVTRKAPFLSRLNPSGANAFLPQAGATFRQGEAIRKMPLPWCRPCESRAHKAAFFSNSPHPFFYPGYKK